MKPTSLRQALEHVDPAAAALITPQGVTPFLRLVNSRWTGANASSVVVFCSDLSNMLRAMTALDGAVDAFCAMSTTLEMDDIAALLAQWPFDTVITDGVKAHVRDTPWGLQAKRHREQACLGSHRSSMSAGLRKPYSASEQGAGQQIRRVRRCDIYGLRARRASRFDHNIW